MDLLPKNIKENINRLAKSKDGKVLLKNFSYLSILEMTIHLFPLITTPYLARVLGVEGFGVLAIGTAVIAYFQSLTNYGFVYTSVRDAARCRDDVCAFSRVVCNTLYAKMLLMATSLVLIAIGTITIPFLKENAAVIWCTALLLPGYVLNPDWIFQAIEDMKYITVRNLIAKTLFTILIFVFIKKPGDYLWQPILIALGMLVPSVCGLIVLHKKYGLKIVITPIKEPVRQIVNGFNMFITVFLPTVYTNLNVLLLGAYNGKSATGVYSGGTKFTSIAYSLFQLLSRTVFPYFSRKMDAHKVYVKFSLALSFVISLTIFFLARPLVLLFLGSSFEGTTNVLRIVAFTPIAMSLMNSYGVNYLVLKGKEKLMRNIIIFVTTFGVTIGAIGAIYYSYIGVAFASLITQFLRAGLITYYAKKQSQK